MELYSKACNLKKGLKRARKRAGYTQVKLAEKLDVSIKTIMNWEQGIATPSIDTLIGLCDLYGCDLDYLMGKIDCRTHDVQEIHEYTGLSEQAIETLHRWTEKAAASTEETDDTATEETDDTIIEKPDVPTQLGAFFANNIRALNYLIESDRVFAMNVLSHIPAYVKWRIIEETETPKQFKGDNDTERAIDEANFKDLKRQAEGKVLISWGNLYTGMQYCVEDIYRQIKYQK